MREQSRASVIMTEPTIKLIDAILHNSVNVMSSQKEELGISEYPLFTHRDIEEESTRWLARRLRHPFNLGDSGVTCEFFDAGHILGSVGMLLRVKGKTIFYTGDMHVEDQTISRAADFPKEPVDVLIMETTRGARARRPDYTRASEIERLGQSIKRTFDQGGSILMPVFALGKSQELLMIIHELKKSGAIPNLPVYVGGLSTKITLIHDALAGSVRRHFEGFKLLENIEVKVTPKKSKGDMEYRPRCLFALSSGMMSEKTVSNKLAQRFLDNPKNTLVFVGYTDVDSPAGKIRVGKQGDMVQLSPDKPPIPRLCQIDEFDFSSHATREELRAFANQMKPKQIILVHGDIDAQEWFEKVLKEDMPNCDVRGAQPGTNMPLAI